MEMKVCVVIPNWNGADLIAESLLSLQAQTYPASIIVVDNGSVDNSVEIIENEFPQVQLIKLPQNTGFSGGVNRGIESALEQQADAVALFNNDAEADKDWLKNLIETMADNPKAGIVTGKFMRMDKQLFDSTGDNYSVWGVPFPRGRNQKDSGQYDELEPVLSATGGASLYRTEMLKQIGLFDEDFFAYYEDVDISLRARLAGWEVLYQPQAVAYHHVSATSSKLGSFTRYHTIKNFFQLYLKNMPPPLLILYSPLFLASSVIMLVKSVRRGLFAAHLKGLAKALALTPRTLQKRWRIQHSRKVPVGTINSLLYKHLPPRIPELEDKNV
jgi:GT2 family glycosyltransferase